MWPFLPKKCDCSETPTNPGTSCDHSGLTTNDLVYDGADGVCSHVTTGMTATEAFQQLDYFICSIQLTQYILDLIQNNIEDYPDFVTLVNETLLCETVIACGPTPPPTTTTTSSSSTSTSTSTTSTTTTAEPTTTTTTTIAEACYVYDLTAITDNGNWTAELCFGGVTGGILPFIGNTFTTPCIINTSLILNGITATTDFLKCDELTTTTTSTSTSTSSTTTTTTTVCPCEYITVIITEGYIHFSDTSSVDVTFTNCENKPDSITYTVAGTYFGDVCSPDINSIEGHFDRIGMPQTVSVFPTNTHESCCNITTTTTTTETTSCYSFTMTALVPENLGFTYVDCFGEPQYIVLNDESLIVCAFPTPTCASAENKWDVTIGDVCGL